MAGGGLPAAVLSNELQWLLASLVLVVAMKIVAVIYEYPSMFTKLHGRMHALTGFVYLIWLVVGFGDAFFPAGRLSHLYYDIILGIFGIVLTVSAAYGFGHKHVKNVASGTLDPHATVTHSEMIEHAFYQGLNLVQIVYLHVMGTAFVHSLRLEWRLIICLLATGPWLLRHLFPINKFSDNYVKEDRRSSNLIRLLYRLKKYQYVFLKHFLQQGLNISIAASNSALALTNQQHFRLYWLLLNASFVLEFFMQTLVKRRYMAQASLLWMQKCLMGASSVAALFVLQYVWLPAATISMLLNFTNRKHDFLNTFLLLVGVALYLHAAGSPSEFSQPL